MSDKRGRRSETEPPEHHGEPLRRLEPLNLTAEPNAYVFLQPGWAERLEELAPRDPASKPFLAGPLTVSCEFSGTLYPGAAERLMEAAKRHPEYCNVCDGFPCQGGHPSAG